MDKGCKLKLIFHYSAAYSIQLHRLNIVKHCKLLHNIRKGICLQKTCIIYEYRFSFRAIGGKSNQGGNWLIQIYIETGY